MSTVVTFDVEFLMSLYQRNVTSLFIPILCPTTDTDTQVSFVAHNNDKLFQTEKKTENITILNPIISAVVLGRNVTGLNSSVVVKIALSTKVCNTVKTSVYGIFSHFLFYLIVFICQKL